MGMLNKFWSTGEVRHLCLVIIGMFCFRKNAINPIIRHSIIIEIPVRKEIQNKIDVFIKFSGEHVPLLLRPNKTYYIQG